MVRARVDEAVRRMDLVKRDEFEAMAELARRAAVRSEGLEARVALLEASAKPSAPAPASMAKADVVEPDFSAPYHEDPPAELS